jgi:hypothetical protein
MKILSLNTAHGQLFNPLVSYIENIPKDIDVICLQEVMFGKKPGFNPKKKARINLFNEIKKDYIITTTTFITPPKYARYFYQELLPKDVQSGLCIFVKKVLK